MATPMSSSLLCLQCGATFRRAEHCQRHVLSHGIDRPFKCIFCPRSFKRRDVLKRHWQTCKIRLDQGLDVPTIASKTRGKKRKACDRCVRLKRACTLDYPCGGCSEKNEACSFERLNQMVEAQDCEGESSPEPCDGVDPIFALPHPGGQGYEELSILDQLDAMPPTNTFDNVNQSLSFSASLPWPFDLGSTSVHEMETETDQCLLLQQRATSLPFKLDFDLISLSKFPFLSKFTAASGFAESFECGDRSEREDLVNNLDKFCHEPRRHSRFESGQVDTNPTYSHQNQPKSHLWSYWESLPWDYDLGKSGDQLYLPGMSALSTSFSTPSDYGIANSSQIDKWFSSRSLDLLQRKTQEIVDEIKAITSKKPRNSKIIIEWSPLLNRMCLQFFSPANLRKFLALYWSFWNPNCPMIHKPTFRVAEASPILLSTMALIGACLSPDRADQAGATVWLNSVEEVIFCGGELFEEPVSWFEVPGQAVSGAKQSLEVLQAAYLLCLLQHWEGSQESKRRIRRHRYNAVVAFARDLGLSNATLNYVPTDDICIFRWENFILQESLIRSLIYVFLLDSAFAIFNNLPPRMVLPELKMDLACPEPCFQAESAEECFIELTSWTFTQPAWRKLDISEAVERLCQSHWSEETRTTLSNLSTLNMFVLVSGLYISAFHIQTSLILNSDITPIHSGLDNWKQLWLARSTSLYSNECQENLWKRVGFIKHAPEWWLLVNGMLERSSVPQTQKYDEADMSSVSALIKGMQSISLMM